MKQMDDESQRQGDEELLARAALLRARAAALQAEAEDIHNYVEWRYSQPNAQLRLDMLA